MLSLIYGLIQHTLQYLYLKKTEQEDIDVVISHIKCSKSAIEQEKKILNEEGCYYKFGNITRITTNYILIDDRYMYEKYDDSTSHLKVDDKVYYLAFLRDANAELKVRKIIYVVNDEDWNNVGPQSEDNVTHTQMIEKNLIAKVTKREGRVAIVEPNNIRIDLSKVQSEFIPLIGDWLTIESLVEVNYDSTSLNGEILEVDKIKPLRSKLSVGVITNYESKNQVGVIDKNVIFHKGACEPGYVPCIGDKVVSDSIESDQGIYKWRSITVVPLRQNSDEPVELTSVDNCHSVLSDTRDLLQNKHGIVIDDNFKFNLGIGEEDTLTIAIHNSGDSFHTLQNSAFVRKKGLPSQLSVISPENMNIDTIINPSESVSYTFKCKAKFIGKSEELFIFHFKDFEIGRLFRITVTVKNISRNNNVPALITQKNNQNTNFNPDDLDDTTAYIPGVRPFKPATFVKIRNGIFKVPRYIWSAVLNNMQKCMSQMEREIALGDEIPRLLTPFTFETYKERFHILLYLEEVAQVLSLQQYNIQSAIMKRRGEYLALEVPGLAEKRPSLLIGDRAVVSFQWDSSQGHLKYEGYIHKITGSEIFLKFNEKFHQEYNSEDCQVTFKCSYTTIQRCHNAVNLAVVRLGPEFLFPTKVVEKEPQYYLEEHEIEKKPARKRITISNGSLSSLNSITSGSEASLENAFKTSSPRVSVVERLFNVKPLESLSAEGNTSIPKPEIANHEEEIANHQNNITENYNGNENNITSEQTSKSTIQVDNEMKLCINRIKRRKLNWFNKQLNHYQREAVRNILSGVARPLPYVIFGPPGTGKTVTLCETILQIFTLVPESRLLVATPSNSSANLIVERLLDANILKPGNLVRLIANHCLNDDSIPEKLIPYCATAELGEERTVKGRENQNREDGLRLNCTMSVLGRHRITIGTCSTLGILYNIGFPRGHFSHVLIDEAGQATEPEIMIPLNFIHSDNGQVILAGDSMQLGPVVQSKLAEYYGLGESFLSRLLHQFPYQRDPEGFETCYDPRLVTKLIMNYRSLPEILELFNSLFYESELQSQISLRKSEEAKLLETLRAELPERDGSPPAVIFHGVDGENRQDTESPSWYNQEEAAQVYLYLLKLYKCGLGPDDIGIITPYLKQVMKIKELILELDLEMPKLSSVEGFQGQERKVIILSVVRSCNTLVDQDIKHALGFVASPRRLNVAISRARALLIIIGNPKLLTMDPYWRSVLIYCMDHGMYTGCNYLPSYITDMQNE